ncbi:MAG TPA: von Willebrand factor type A domain-containing protein [Myxococcota bacterium]|nr:von Willebrand factor type A domain-containing protein [Myxococcota bacterium]HRY92798.1 von Willebrand factor type A domain-containing protein [Myxococcota bacterium]HSA19826.1 von Willebrand factor type A domain-containing protein [Myxococcota bacterium]
MHIGKSWIRGGVALWLLGLALSSDTLAAQGGAIEGKVLANGAPVQGAAVAAAGPAARVTATDAQGVFSLADLPAGTYALTVSKAGFATERRSLSLAAGQTLKLVVSLRPAAPAGQPAADKTAKPMDAVVEEKRSEVASRGDDASGRAAGGAPAARPASVAPVAAAEPEYAPRPSAPPAKAKIASGGGGLLGGAVGSSSSAGPMRLARAGEDRDRGANTEQYVDPGLNQWTDAEKDSLSTFAVDVDTGSYTIVRRKLREGGLPPTAAVRVEEFVNYFRYDYPAPTDIPFRVDLEAAPSPFEKNLTLLRVGMKGMEAKAGVRKPLHLTFLVDTSGSMQSADKLGLVKRSLRFLVDQLQDHDTVALCTYAGSVREVLRPTDMAHRARIHEAIESLSAGGSTAMGTGLELAYRQAWDNFKQGHENRVIVLSDGDANVGRTSHGDMLTSISWYAQRGVTLSTIGFGRGNYKDHKMEQLANKGNGNYFYIDSFSEAKRVFGEKLAGTLQVIAKDVKIQVEFPPKAVKKYRLVGYENRDIADRDFRNDKVDAGEIGAGHTVTAIYEVEVTNPRTAWAIARVRWKAPDGDRADEREFAIDGGMTRESFAQTTADTKRAVAAAALAENLRRSPFRESWTMQKARELAQASLSRESPEEIELMELIDRAAKLIR